MGEIVFGGRKLEWEEPDTLLECLEKGGVNVPSSCRSGVCQSCLVKAVKGAPPEHSQEDLRETWKQQGLFLSCISKNVCSLEVALPDAAVGMSTGTVVGKQLLGEDVVRFQLKTDAPFEFRAGQFANLIRPDGLTRSYSIASIPADGVLEFQVRKVTGGKMSCWLYDEMQPGQSLTVRGPNGDCFYVPGQPAQPLLLIGTGTGLAPLVGIARDALNAGHTGPIHLVHGGKNINHLYLHEELTALGARHKNFHYLPAVTEPTTDVSLNVGRVNVVLDRKLPNLKNHRVFLCGSPPMVKDLKQHVYRAGAALDDILADAFISAPPPPKPVSASRPNLLALAPPNAAAKKESRPWLQQLRYALQAMVFTGFILQGILYYTLHIRPLGNLLPFTAYDALGHMVVSSALIAWGTLFLLVMVFGRFVCGWLCPIGFIQDSGERLLNLFKIKLRRPLNQPRVVRLVLAIMVLGHLVVMPLLAAPVRLWQFDLHFREPWLLGFPFRVGLFALDLALVFVVIGIVLPYFFGPRPYCKMVCETGFLLDQVSQFSFGRIRRNHGFDQDTCLSCQRCTNICPQGINVHEEVHLFDRVVNSNCITCLQCVNTCPNDTIIYSLRKRVADTGKVAGYLASINARAGDMPRHVLTGAGTLVGAYLGFLVIPKSYFHTYLLFASLGGLTGLLLWRTTRLAFGEKGLEDSLQEQAMSLVERENKERLLPLTKQERLHVTPTKKKEQRSMLPVMAVVYLMVAGVIGWVVTHIPPRIGAISEIPSDKRKAAVRDAEKVLYLGLPPSVSEDDMHLTYASLHDYLSREMQMDVRLVTGTTYGEVGHALASGHIDAAFLPSGAAFGVLKRQPGAEVLLAARVVVNGETTYSGSLVALAGGPKTLAEVRGQRLAVTGLDSLSGYLAPMAVLRWEGIRPTDLGEIVMAGNHSRALALLHSGRVDVAATFDGAVALFKQRFPHVELRTLGSFRDLPTDMVLVNASLSPTRRYSLVSALKRISTEPSAADVRGDLAHGAITGFAEGRESDFVGMERWIESD